jgi:hypothetical protein
LVLPFHRALLFGCGLTLAAALPACREEVRRPPPVSVAAPEPVAPASLLARFVLPRPQRSYEAFHAANPGAGLPAQFVVLLVHQLGLPPLVSGRFLPQHAVVGAFSVLDGQFGWVLGFRVASGAELVAELSTGPEARFSRVEGTKLVLLRGAKASLAVVDSTVLLASSEVLLRDYADYVARAPLPQALQTAVDVPQVDAEWQLTPAAGGLIDAALASGVQSALSRFEAALRTEISARGSTPDRVNLSELLSLGGDGVVALRKLLQNITHGSFQLRLAGANLALHGEVNAASAEPRARTNPACESFLLPQGSLAAALLPSALLSEDTVRRVHAVLGAVPAPKAVSGNAEDAAQWLAWTQGFQGPLLLGVSAVDARWLLSASGQWQPVAGVAPAGGPLALLKTKAFAASAAKPQPGASAASLASEQRGLVNLLVTGEPVQLAWQRHEGEMRWAFGAEAAGWLERTATTTAVDHFASWKALCGAEPVLALGLKQPAGDIALALAEDKANQLRISAEYPLALLLSALQGASP